MPDGSPTTRPLDEDAAHFLVRQVRAHPGEVTIYAGGPLTNIALAASIEPRFAEIEPDKVGIGKHGARVVFDTDHVQNGRVARSQ